MRNPLHTFSQWILIITPWGEDIPILPGKKLRLQRVSNFCSKSHSLEVAGLGFEPGQLGLELLSLWFLSFWRSPHVPSEAPFYTTHLPVAPQLKATWLSFSCLLKAKCLLWASRAPALLLVPHTDFVPSTNCHAQFNKHAVCVHVQQEVAGPGGQSLHCLLQLWHHFSLSCSSSNPHV